MFRARWAHIYLAIVSVLTVLVVAVYAGLQGWLGGTAHEVLTAIFERLLGRLPTSDDVDRTTRVIGAIGTAAWAAFGVYKGIYYAKRNLPARLKQLLGEAERLLATDRGPLIAAIAEARPGVRASKSVFYVEPLNRALEELHLPKLPEAFKHLEDAVTVLEDSIELSELQAQNIAGQKVLTHILRGSIYSARAEETARWGKSADDDRAAAEKEFDKALEIRPNDLDALELRGRQRELRGNDVGALDDYEKLSKASKAAELPLRAARGYRLQGTITESGSTRQKLAEARDLFGTGITLMNEIGSLNSDEMFEKALLHKSYAGVQIKRTRIPTARLHLRQALGYLAGVSTHAAREHEEDAKNMLAQITPSAVPVQPVIPHFSLLERLKGTIERLGRSFRQVSN